MKDVLTIADIISFVWERTLPLASRAVPATARFQELHMNWSGQTLHGIYTFMRELDQVLRETHSARSLDARLDRQCVITCIQRLKGGCGFQHKLWMDLDQVKNTIGWVELKQSLLNHGLDVQEAQDLVT